MFQMGGSVTEIIPALATTAFGPHFQPGCNRQTTEAFLLFPVFSSGRKLSKGDVMLQTLS